MNTRELEKFFALDLARKLAGSEPGTKEHERYRQLYKAWRLFFFCFYAQGLCFVDLSYLKEENIRCGVLTYYRRKTGQLIDIKVTEDMRYIIESFRDETCGSPYLFPIITLPGVNERTQYSSALRAQNRRLQELSEMAGLERKVTTHVVRHTYTTLLKRNHLPVSVISQSLGHTTEKTTAIYLDSLDRSVIERVNEKVTAPYRLISRSGPKVETDYGKRIVDLLQSHVIDSDKAQMVYPLLQGIFRMIDIHI
ncbi:MAG: tyrosine-type recombinase/integrase [Bacteroides sp.]|nr:tyrosine-type recombinase/integrase [Bacteroides sp.]